MHNCPLANQGTVSQESVHFNLYKLCYITRVLRLYSDGDIHDKLVESSDKLEESVGGGQGKAGLSNWQPTDLLWLFPSPPNVASTIAEGFLRSFQLLLLAPAPGSEVTAGRVWGAQAACTAWGQGSYVAFMVEEGAGLLARKEGAGLPRLRASLWPGREGALCMQFGEPGCQYSCREGGAVHSVHLPGCGHARLPIEQERGVLQGEVLELWLRWHEVPGCLEIT